MDDAMDQWRRELEAARPGLPASQGPPGAPSRRRDRDAWKHAPEGVAAAVGALVTAAIVLLEGFPPQLDPPTPLYVATPILGAVAGRLMTAGGLRALSAAVVASLAGIGTFCVLVPALAVLDFLECWASWLSDC